MLQLLGVVVALGLAGIDPVAAFIALGALTAGATKRAVLAFSVTSLVTPMVLGVALSRTLGADAADLDLSFLGFERPWWAAIEGVLAVVLLGWAVRRWRNRTVTKQPTRRTRGTSVAALTGFGLVYGISFVTDPTYLATVVVAGREDWTATVLAHVLWSGISQAPLIGVAVAVATGRHTSAVRLMTRLRTRLGPATSAAITVLLVVSAVVLAVDVATWVATGEYLIG